MRLIFPLMQERNPIALREHRAYARAVPLWARRLETVGVIAAALIVCLGLVLYWLHARAGMSLHYVYHLMGFETSAAVQIIVAVFYGAALLRCTFAGVSVASHYQRDARDDLALTGLTATQIVRGQWAAALYPARGWLVALGLVRFVAVILMLAEYQFNVYWNHLADIASNGAVCCNSHVAFDYGFSPVQIPLALSMAIGLTLLDGWATTGIGLLMGSRVRSSAPAWAAAIGLRALPILIFTGFPLISGTSSYDLLSVRWYEYTWFAFADGGTGALLRLTLPMRLPYGLNGWAVVTRSLLSFLAAAHMLLIYGLGSAVFLMRRWRRLRETAPIRVHPPRWSLSPGNIAIVAVALAMCAWLPVTWSQRAGDVFSAVDSTFFYDPAFLGGLESLLRIAVGFTTLAAILVGVQRGRTIRTQRIVPASLSDLGRLGLSVFRTLRGWWLGLGLLLMTAYGVLIAEHLINFQSVRLYDCAFPQYHYCGYTYFGWPLIQWVLGLGMIVVLSGAIVLSGGMLGLGAGSAIRATRWAIVLAVAVRLIPVGSGLLPPEALTPDDMYGILAPRWKQDPLLILTDGGVSLVIGMAEPYWHTGHVGGRTNVAYGLLAFTGVMYLLLGYSLGGLALARWSLRGHDKAAREAHSTEVSEAVLLSPC